MVENKMFDQLKIYKVYQYRARKPFTEFVEELYRRRLEYK